MQIKSPTPYLTIEAIILKKLSRTYWGNNPDKAMDYANQCPALSEQIGYKKGIGDAYNSIGVIYYKNGKYLEALNFHKKDLIINEKIGDKIYILFSYLNIGNICANQGNYSDALKNYFACLKIAEETEDNQIIAWANNKIGIINENQANYPEAFKNYSAALHHSEATGDKKYTSQQSTQTSGILIQHRVIILKPLRMCLMD